VAVGVLVTASGVGDNNTPPVVPSAGTDRYWLIAVMKSGTWTNIPSTVIVAGTTSTTLNLIASNNANKQKSALYGCKDADFGTSPTSGNGDLTYNADGDTPSSTNIVVAGIVCDGVDQTTPFTDQINVGWDTDSTGPSTDFSFTLDEVDNGAGVAFCSDDNASAAYVLTDNSYAKQGDGPWTQSTNCSAECASKLITSTVSTVTTTLTAGSDDKGTLAIMLLPTGGAASNTDVNFTGANRGVARGVARSVG